MNQQFETDLAKKPNLFHFDQAIRSEDLEAWLNNYGFRVPADLKQFWHKFGGGEMFESETILSPFGDPGLGDDIESVNRFHWESGMPPEWLIFHIGIGLSVVQLQTGQYASMNPNTYEIQQTFESLANWYMSFIRREYAARYGLASC